MARINIDQYPADYYYVISQDTLSRIVNYLNQLGEKLNDSYDLLGMINVRDIARQSKKDYDRTLNEINGIIAALAAGGIVIEYDWPGHRGEFFAATYDDACTYEDYLDSLED